MKKLTLTLLCASYLQNVYSFDKVDKQRKIVLIKNINNDEWRKNDLQLNFCAGYVVGCVFSLICIYNFFNNPR